MILLGYIFGVGYALLCLVLALIFYKCGMPKNYTRKLVHILVGLEWVILYHFMGASLHFLAVCVFFLILLFVAYKKSLMPMISSDGENAPGTVYYAVAMTGVATVAFFVPSVMVPFGIGIACTSLGDGMAGVVGQLLHKYSPKIYKNKTLLGALADFVFSFLAAFVISRLWDMPLSVGFCLLIALFSTELELFTGAGLDNITITWGVTALTYGLVFYGGMTEYLLPILATPIIIALAYSKKALTVGGIVLAVILDAVISLSLGSFGFTVLASFFVGSLIIDKAKKRIKQSRGIVTEGKKGECRDVMQVLANGGTAAICAAGWYFTGEEAFVVAFLASLAEAFADTASSGLGMLSRVTVDPFRFRRCEAGLSGGMSLIGTISALLAAVLISSLGLAFGVLSPVPCVVAALVAFLGSVLDSMLGSLVQRKNKCSVCGRITERDTHCDTATERYSGISFVDNDIVNLLSGIFTAVIAALCYIFLI